MARELAAAERERRGNGRVRLTFAGHVHRHWLPRKTRRLRPTTLEGYRRLRDLHILPTLGAIPLRALRQQEARKRPPRRFSRVRQLAQTQGLLETSVPECAPSDG